MKKLFEIEWDDAKGVDYITPELIADAIDRSSGFDIEATVKTAEEIGDRAEIAEKFLADLWVAFTRAQEGIATTADLLEAAGSYMMEEGIVGAVASKHGRIERARRTMQEEFAADPDFRRGYVDNVACVIMDRVPGFTKDKAKRDAVAEAIVRRVFEDE